MKDDRYIVNGQSTTGPNGYDFTLYYVWDNDLDKPYVFPSRDQAIEAAWRWNSEEDRR